MASAAVLERPDELTWEREERDGIWYYRIGVIDSEVESRQAEIVRGFLDRDCHVALMPELSCSARLLRGWREHLSAEYAPASQLRWVLSGTGDLDLGARPVNASVLLDAATGEELVRHDKLYGFTLTPRQITSWKLPLAADHALDEDIKRGSRLRLVQTGVGWLSIFICQDLAELHALDARIIEHGVRWLFVPVFSEATKWQRWEHQKAKHYATEAGTSTVVSNSLVVSRCQGHTGPREVSLACGPGGAIDHAADSATEIVGFRIGEAEITKL